MVAAVLVALPLPYYLLSPGTAVDLSHAIVVDAHAPPRDTFYLTDVTLQRATPIAFAATLIPGYAIVPLRELVPPGMSTNQYQSILVEGMDESQSVAAVVAERAAGYHVPNPPSRVFVQSFTRADVPAARSLRVGDIFVSVDGSPITTTTQITQIVGRRRAGSTVAVEVSRGGQVLRFDVPTIPTKKGARFGVLVGVRSLHPILAVPVRFAIEDVSGSSGGLMFALDIYAALDPAHVRGGRAIAGTGTLSFDGTVGAIEGTYQKLLAAKRAGATVFICPRENYDDVRDVRDMRIVPVHTFAQAVAALRG